MHVIHSMSKKPQNVGHNLKEPGVTDRELLRVSATSALNGVMKYQARASVSSAIAPGNTSGTL